MTEYITKIRTETGDKQIDYNALANLPTTDKTLSVSDQAADAKVTGDTIQRLSDDVNTLETKKSDKAYVDEQLALKTDKTYTDEQLALKSNQTYVDEQLALKSDVSYLDERIDEIKSKVDITYLDTQLATKADKTYTDEQLNLKANKIDVDEQFATKEKLADTDSRLDLLDVYTQDLNKRIQNITYNILDNSDFTNPINQRGSDSYSNPDGTGSGSYDGSIYSIDRWCLGLGMSYSADFSELSNDSTTERGIFFQKFDDGKIEHGGKYTLAVSIYGDEGIEVHCGVVTAFDTSLEALPDGYSPTITIPERGISLGLEYHPWDLGFKFVISLEPDTFFSLNWAAVYEGEYTEETLPKYQPKGYLTEYNECLRYYYKGSFQSYGYMYGSSTAYVCVPMPVRMRVTPTVTLGNSVAITVRDAKGTKVEISKLGSNVYRNGNVVRFSLNVTDAGLLSNSPLSTGTTGNIEFSANL